MFDPISVIISTLKNFIQRITGIFSLILDTYFPKVDKDEKDEAFFFSFI